MVPTIGWMSISLLAFAIMDRRKAVGAFSLSLTGNYGNNTEEIGK